MMKKDSLRTLIGTLNSSSKGRVPALRIVQSDPQQAANISKLIRDPDNGSFNINRKNAELNINSAQMQAISDNVRARSNDNESIMQLFPDIELAVQILVSCILSPKDMVKTELIYKTSEPIFPNELLTQLNSIVETELNNHYKLEDLLQGILRDTLFETGSHVRVVLPESIVDSMINENTNVSMEGMVDIFKGKNEIRPLGFLGNPNSGTTQRYALEAFFEGNKSTDYESKIKTRELGKGDADIALEHIDVTDNFQFLKIPKLIEVGNRQKVKNLTKSFSENARKYSAESIKDGKKLSVNELSSMLYKDNSRDYQALMVLPSSDNIKRKSIGRPLEMRLPSECAIPVYVPGDVSKHIGYFIMSDIDGNPVSKDISKNEMDGLNGLLANQSNNQSMSSLLIDKAKKNMIAANAAPTLDNITAIYGSIIENDLMQRLNNGIYGSNVKVADDQEFYRIMLARALKSKMTRLVYIPAEYVTYFAFKFFKNGVGKSYLDDVKNLTSIRAILMFAKVMAQVKSAINVTKVEMNLDPDDPDPEKSIEMAQHEFAKMRQMYFPLGINSPVDLTDWITRAGMEWVFKNHPGIPETSFEVTTDNMKHEIPDNELDDELRKQTYMAFGLTPEQVDNGFNAEFATTSVQNNVLMSKRVSNLQDTFTNCLSKHAGCIIRNDQIVRDKLIKVFKENKALLEKVLSDEEKKDYTEDSPGFIEIMLERYVEHLRLELPRPDVTSLETQTTAFNEYDEAITKAIDYWIGERVASGQFIGMAGEQIETMKESYKALVMRNWMAANNYLSELGDIVQTDENEKPVVDVYEIQRLHSESLARSFVGFLKSLKPIKVAADADLTKLGETEPSGSSLGSEEPSGTSEEGGGFGEDLGGGEDLGNTELPPLPEETPTSEEAPEATGSTESIVNSKPGDNKPGVLFFN